MLTTTTASVSAPPILTSRAQAVAAAAALWPRLHERARQAEADRLVPRESIQEIAGRALRADLYATVALPSFEEFCRRHRQIPLFKADRRTN